MTILIPKQDRGAKHWHGPYRALDEQEVAEMRRLYRVGHVPGGVLAERYGVSVRTVWRYLGDDPSAQEVRVRAVVERWARLYALPLGQQERDALVAMVARTLDLMERAEERHRPEVAA